MSIRAFRKIYTGLFAAILLVQSATAGATPPPPPERRTVVPQNPWRDRQRRIDAIANPMGIETVGVNFDEARMNTVRRVGIEFFRVKLAVTLQTLADCHGYFLNQPSVPGTPAQITMPQCMEALGIQLKDATTAMILSLIANDGGRAVTAMGAAAARTADSGRIRGPIASIAKNQTFWLYSGLIAGKLLAELGTDVLNNGQLTQCVRHGLDRWRLQNLRADQSRANMIADWNFWENFVPSDTLQRMRDEGLVAAEDLERARTQMRANNPCNSLVIGPKLDNYITDFFSFVTTVTIMVYAQEGLNLAGRHYAAPALRQTMRLIAPAVKNVATGRIVSLWSKTLAFAGRATPFAAGGVPGFLVSVGRIILFVELEKVMKPYIVRLMNQVTTANGGNYQALRQCLAIQSGDAFSNAPRAPRTDQQFSPLQAAMIAGGQPMGPSLLMLYQQQGRSNRCENKTLPEWVKKYFESLDKYSERAQLNMYQQSNDQWMANLARFFYMYQQSYNIGYDVSDLAKRMRDIRSRGSERLRRLPLQDLLAEYTFSFPLNGVRIPNAPLDCELSPAIRQAFPGSYDGLCTTTRLQATRPLTNEDIESVQELSASFQRPGAARPVLFHPGQMTAVRQAIVDAEQVFIARRPMMIGNRIAPQCLAVYAAEAAPVARAGSNLMARLTAVGRSRITPTMLHSDRPAAESCFIHRFDRPVLDLLLSNDPLKMGLGLATIRARYDHLAAGGSPEMVPEYLLYREFLQQLGMPKPILPGDMYFERSRREASVLDAGALNLDERDPLAVVNPDNRHPGAMWERVKPQNAADYIVSSFLCGSTMNQIVRFRQRDGYAIRFYTPRLFQNPISCIPSERFRGQRWDQEEGRWNGSVISLDKSLYRTNQYVARGVFQKFLFELVLNSQDQIVNDFPTWWENEVNENVDRFSGDVLLNQQLMVKNWLMNEEMLYEGSSDIRGARTNRQTVLRQAQRVYFDRFNDSLRWLGVFSEAQPQYFMGVQKQKSNTIHMVLSQIIGRPQYTEAHILPDFGTVNYARQFAGEAGADRFLGRAQNNFFRLQTAVLESGENSCLTRGNCRDMEPVRSMMGQIGQLLKTAHMLVIETQPVLHQLSLEGVRARARGERAALRNADNVYVMSGLLKASFDELLEKYMELAGRLELNRELTTAEKVNLVTLAEQANSPWAMTLRGPQYRLVLTQKLLLDWKAAFLKSYGFSFEIKAKSAEQAFDIEKIRRYIQ